MAGKHAGHFYLIYSSQRRVRGVYTKLQQLVVVIEEDVGGSDRSEGRLDRILTLVPELEGIQAG
jgi:beta-xylosidase